MSLSTSNILSSTKIVDSTDQTKSTSINLSGAITATSTTLAFNQTTNRTISFPNNSGTVALTSDIPEIQTGTQTSVSHVINPVTTSITFGSTFSSAPTVSLAIKNFAHKEKVVNASPSSITTTGFDAIVNVDNYATTNLSVIASSATGGNAGTWVEVVDGKPCIVYTNTGLTPLKFARNSEADGSGTWISYTVVSPYGGRSPIFKVINGYPTICYWNSLPDEIRLYKCSTTNGTGTWSLLSTINAGLGEYHQYITMEQVNGGLCVASRHVNGGGALRFHRNANSDGSGAWTTYTVASSCAQPYMKVVAGRPAITYNISGKTLFIRANDANGTSWPGSPAEIESAVTGKYNSMEIVNGFPAVAYITSSGLAKYAINSLADGSGTWSTYTVDADGNGDAVLRTSLSIIGGYPAIAYMNDANTSLKYARSTNVDGTGSWIINTVDNTSAQAGQWTSMTNVNGNVGISYIDVTNANAKFAYGTFDTQYDVDYIAVN